MATATRSIDLVFDTYAWIETLEGTARGEEIAALLAAHDVATPTVVLGEIADVVGRRKPEHVPASVEAVMSTSILLDLPSEIAVAAGELRTELRPRRRGIGMIDCIVLATARHIGAEVVTGDPHLRDLDGVRWVGD